MTQIGNIVFEDDVYYSDAVVEKRRARSLSKLINSLLRTHLNIIKKAVPAEIRDIDDELQDLSVRKALLMDKKDVYNKKKAEEAEEWVESK